MALRHRRNVVQGFWDGLSRSGIPSRLVPVDVRRYGRHGRGNLRHSLALPGVPGFGINIGQGLIDGLAAMGPGVKTPSST